MTHPTVNRKSANNVLERPGRCVGYGVYDPLGRRIGKAEKIFVNGDDQPEYIRVKMGVFAWKEVLLPVESVAVDEEHRAITLE